MNPFIFPLFDRFSHPEAFWLLGIVPLLWFWQWRQRNRQPAMLFPSVPPGNLRSRAWQWLRLVPEVLRFAGILFLVTALARPQIQERSREKLPVEGIDMVIAMDVSRSMEAEDLKPNRLEAAKKAARDFVAARPSDRIGLVIYAAESVTACPPTTQHALLQNVIQNVGYQNLEDGTAIGLGLAMALNRLKTSRAKSKVVVLLTDGENNAGFIAPLTAAEMARRLKIKVYTIGVGREGLAPFPVRNFAGQKTYQQVPFTVNEGLLRQMAAQTGGAFYRADSREALQWVYRRIDKLEKSRTRTQVQYSYREVFAPFVLWALAFLALETLLRYTVFRSIGD